MNTPEYAQRGAGRPKDAYVPRPYCRFCGTKAKYERRTGKYVCHACHSKTRRPIWL